MKRLPFRVLYREFLFRIIDWETLSKHAEGDSHTLLGQFASLLIFCSVILALFASVWAAHVRNDSVPPLTQQVDAWTMEHFLISTTMLVIGLMAVLSWESIFPNRRDVLVLGPLPVRTRTLFLAKVAAVAMALGLALTALHVVAGIAWPLALAQYHSTPAPALVFDALLPPVRASDFPSVMNRDIAPLLRRLDLAAIYDGAGIVNGVSAQGVQRIVAYGKAKPDSLFEIGSVTKTFTGLLLAQMAVRGELDLRDPVRNLLLPRVVAHPKGFEVTLLDLATHHSGLPLMPDNTGPSSRRESFTNYQASDLYDFIQRHGLERPSDTKFLYSNVGFAVLGTALANRAGISYSELLRRNITEPLGMKDTVIAVSPGQRGRLLPGYGDDGRRTPAWDLDAFASAGGIRSTAGDMLTYLEAPHNPERTPLRAALMESQKFRDYVAGNVRIALAWVYDPDTGVYAHDGATGGFTSYSFFDPHHDFAAIVLLNAHPVQFPMATMIGEHVRQRLSGEPALSLRPVSVPPSGPVRSFLAYWIAMIAAGVFMFCCVLSLQGVAAQLLPRRWFLRASAFLQLTVFSVLLSAYFLQRSPVGVLISGAQKPWLACIPSYWFVGLYQEVSGSLHPELRPFALGAWIGLFTAIFLTAAAYAASYFRTVRQIVEEPDITLGVRSGWLPRLGNVFQTGIIHFSIRSLLRSHQHRMIFAFYLGVGLAFSLLFINAPSEVSGPTAGGPWDPLSVPLLASTTTMMGVAVVGARKVFSLPLDLRANWIFQAMPFHAGRQCLGAQRRSLLTLSVVPVWVLSAVLLLQLWPWRPAAAHLAVLLLLGIVLVEFPVDGIQRIPFACSYIPGKSRLYLSFWLWGLVLLVGIVEAAVNERDALKSYAGTTTVLLGLGSAVAFCLLRNNWLAQPNRAELRFEDVPADQVLTLDLS